MVVKLYSFEKLHSYLDEHNYPKVSSNGFQIIKTDFKQAYTDGKISFKEDGIYLENNGKKLRGYIFRGKKINDNYIGEYRVSLYNKFPKFHLAKCEKISDFIEKGKLKEFYIWSNYKNTDVIDKNTQEIHENITLNLCNYCKDILINPEETTEEFYNKLEKEGVFSKKGEDLFGYKPNWQKISNDYRKKHNYTCQSCGRKVEKKDKHFIHTHHKDGNKLNNYETNLQCLCILCHSNVDENHKNKINTRDLENFKKRYVIKN